MVLHKLILIIGEDFCHMYNAKPTLLCAAFKAQNNNQSKLIIPQFTPKENSLHSKMIPFYDSYLQKLCYNYEDLKVCFYPNGQLHEYITQNNMTMLHFLSKIQNMLNYLLNVPPLLPISSLVSTSLRVFLPGVPEHEDCEAVCLFLPKRLRLLLQVHQRGNRPDDP